MKHSFPEGPGRQNQFRAPKRRSPRTLCPIVCAVASGWILAASAAAQNGPAITARSEAQTCAALAQLNLENVTGGPAFITSGRLVDVSPSGLEQWPATMSGFGKAGVPARTSIRQYCEVTGYVSPQSKFVLKLPSPGDWNQKFFFRACGGFCGYPEHILSLFANTALARGYASATGNGGHESSLGFDGIWAADAPELQEDFGWRSNHVVTLVTRFITTHYYGKPIRLSYMAGGSKGGQAVLMEAQRFPDDFDGLLAMAPVYEYTARNTIAAAWFAQAVNDGRGGSVLDATAAHVIHESVLQRCGAQDGAQEAYVADPLSCQWKPELIACPSGRDGPDCLSPRQVSAVKRLMSPATNSRGEVLYAFPYLPGTETQWAGWNYPGVANPSIPPRFANMDLPAMYMKYFVDPQRREKGDALSFDFDRDPATLRRAQRIYDATSFDLRAFKARGGKMLLWHGWADAAISATSSVGYYQGATRFMGGSKQTEDFFRLFLIPGVEHIGGGPGLTDFDAFSALENWVEKGQAPDKLIACRSSSGAVERCRPVYPYPIKARYSGTGDPNQAAGFVPVDSLQH